MKFFPLVLSLTTASAMLTTGALHAQGQEKCGFEEARQVLISENPELLHQAAEYELGLQAYLQARAGLRDDDDTVVYHIPIVFHILYDPTTGTDAHNVSDATIYNAVNQLNIRYRKQNADTSEICCGFDAIAADARLQFDLATKDPFGNCTNGIDRITTQRATGAQDYSKLNPWFRDHYMNIWVCNTINTPLVAGYSNYPSDVQGDIGALRDGVMIQSTSLVSFALTHEIGHYLNLQHVWGNTNDPGVACGDDDVADTPITKGYNLFCPGPDNCSICDPNIQENYQNYMDYSYCSVMYTKGQRDRMRASLNSDVSGRRTLWQDANHVYTGIGGNEVTCGPQADFYALDEFVCQGTAVRFKDNSKRATATSWAWTFDGGNPATSTEQNPIVTFDEPGIHAVTLTAGNDFGS
ncbi:MAG: M43 family zinc metalloprotease, partial [Flavobacteriales bacterium]